MAASQTYSNLLAHGVTSGGDVGPVFELWAGDSPDPATLQGQAADAQAIQQFEVLMYDAEGKVVPFTIGDNYSTGSYVVGGQPTAADFITVNGHVITFISTGTPEVDEVLIGGTTTLTAAAIAAVLNSDPELYGVTAVANGTTVTMTALAAGTGAITTTEDVTSASFTVSGATLTGGDTTADTPSGAAVAVAAQPVLAATPGAFVPIYISGCFNHEALIWPAGIATLRQRMLAFAGTGITVKQLL